MEQCVNCKKEFKVKDLFLQWCTSGETYICEKCIKYHKWYTTEACYAEDSDITFVFALARVKVTEYEFVELSQILIGYHYGKPDESYEKHMLNGWLENHGNIRKDLLRQAFNENCKNEEVLY